MAFPLFSRLRRKKPDDAAEAKKKKLPLRQVWSNNLFALRLIWRAAPVYLCYYFLNSVIYAIIDFLSGAFLLRLIVNHVQAGSPPEQIAAYIIAILGANLLINILNQYMWNIKLAGDYVRIEAEIRRMMFAQAGRVELACYEQPAFYDKYVRAMDSANGHVRDVMNTLDGLIWRTVTLVGNSLLIFTIDPVFIAFAAVPLLLGFLRKKNNKLKHDCDSDLKPYNRRKAYIRRTFYLGDYAKEMRQTNMYLRLLEDLRENLDEFKRIYRKYSFRRALYELIMKMGTQVVTVLGATLYAIYHALVSGKILLGDCLVVISSISEISGSLSDFVSKLAEFHEHALYLEDMRTFLSHEPAIPENEAGDTPAGGTLEMRHVTFRYEGAEADALTDVSLTVRPGERIALVGHNGSGKTTLVKLLLHLYEPTEGEITLDGRDWREFNLTGWRQQFSTVFQDYRNFSFTVGQNVLLRPAADPDADRALVEQSLRESGAWEKVESLDHGIDTVLTREFDDKGAVLSGGETQKISLARVFAEPERPFVLLDEPSSALDPIAEHTMFENMMRATAGRSVVFISHRLSSATTADRIYMMEKGRVAEVGTHAELMAKNGKYADMFRKQAENYVGA
ncbi:MAG: ABC transporter ATP-binding protein [Clostridia bacterium]|nr:ABC transporter ATP-binding protein [Clostridia bacterium]